MLRRRLSEYRALRDFYGERQARQIDRVAGILDRGSRLLDRLKGAPLVRVSGEALVWAVAAAGVCAFAAYVFGF